MKNLRMAFLIALIAALSPAFGGSRDLMVFYPGAPGSAEDAANVMTELGNYLAKSAGWPANSVKVIYENDLEHGLATLDKEKPGFALISLPVQLAEGAKLKMKLLVQTLPAGHKSDGYYILGREDGPKDLESAKGLSLASNLFYDKTFLSRVVLGGKNVEEHFTLKPVSSGLRALKAVLGENKKADLVLLDQHQFDAKNELEEAKALKLVHRSPELPTPALVCFEGVTAPADAAALKKALLGMGADPAAKNLLETMTLTGFVEPDAAAYEAAQKLYTK